MPMVRWFLTVARAILDANMLFVYSIGKKYPEMLGSQKRVKEFIPEDFDLLVQLVEGVDQIALTPNAVTECSDLLKDSIFENDAKEALEDLIQSPSCIVAEEFVSSFDAVAYPQYKFLGVADCAMLEFVDSEAFLISADGALSREAAKKNSQSINFNHYRSYAES